MRTAIGQGMMTRVIAKPHLPLSELRGFPGFLEGEGRLIRDGVLFFTFCYSKEKI